MPIVDRLSSGRQCQSPTPTGVSAMAVAARGPTKDRLDWVLGVCWVCVGCVLCVCCVCCVCCVRVNTLLIRVNALLIRAITLSSTR